MCAKAIVDARIRLRYILAQMNHKTGAIESIDQFFDRDHLNHQVLSSGGTFARAVINLLKNFFNLKEKRKSL